MVILNRRSIVLWVEIAIYHLFDVSNLRPPLKKEGPMKNSIIIFMLHCDPSGHEDFILQFCRTHSLGYI